MSDNKVDTNIELDEPSNSFIGSEPFIEWDAYGDQMNNFKDAMDQWQKTLATWSITINGQTTKGVHNSRISNT